MDGKNTPATKADIAGLDKAIGDLRSDTTQNIGDLRSETMQAIEQLRTEVNHGYADVVERIHDSQTALLKAFQG